jgi:hypothetical protein
MLSVKNAVGKKFRLSKYWSTNNWKFVSFCFEYTYIYYFQEMKSLLWFFSYTVIQNFGFSLPKHSVLKNLPKLPIIQLKFRVKPTKHSSQFQHTRSFVFDKIYKFKTKLRDFHRNISGIGTSWPCHKYSTFFRSNQLAAWFFGLRCWLWAQKVLGSSPKQARKEQKIKVLLGDQKSKLKFSRIQSGINNRNFGPEFSAWFW